jgi:predicted ester cyclase
MSMQSNRELIGRYLEALSGKPKPPELVAQFVDDDALRHHIEMFEDAFPSYELRLDDMVAEGDKVCVRATFRGVHKGAFQGIPATGRQASISVMLIYRIAGEKIVEHWLNADSLSLLQQLGAVPAPA